MKTKNRKTRPRNLNNKEIFEWIKDNNITVDKKTNCWFWVSPITTSMYTPSIRIKNKDMNVRDFLKIFVEEIPIHKKYECRKINCVNPNHNSFKRKPKNHMNLFELVQYLLENAVKDKNGCLIQHTKSRHKQGYAMIGHEGKMYLTHRLVALEYHGNPPKDKPHVSHVCERGHNGCINPKHLVWANHKENMNMPNCKQKTTRKPRISSDSKYLTLIKKIIIEMEGIISNKELGNIFGYSENHISSIRHNRVWKDIKYKKRLDK